MKTIENKSNKTIAEDVGLCQEEISLALNAKRLLGRTKLKKIHSAGYDLIPFIFGKSFISTIITEPKEQVNSKGE